MRSESPSIWSECTADDGVGGCTPSAAVRLDGPTRKLDPRVSAYRNDIADIALAGTLLAPHYAEPMRRMALSSVAMRKAPDHGAEAVSQLLPGEHFAVLDIAGEWAWGFSVHDHYVGYVPESSLGEPASTTHRVSVREALIFARPAIKAPVIGTLPFGALLSATVHDSFLAVGAGFIHARHASAVGTWASDAVSVAELFLGAPYLWGGRGAEGIDCSGLVQVALAALGIRISRDTDMQRDSVGTLLPEDEPLRRGDLVFFPGHVGLMVDESRLIHANAFWMGVVVEPLADVVARLTPHHDRPISCRRRIES